MKSFERKSFEDFSKKLLKKVKEILSKVDKKFYACKLYLVKKLSNYSKLENQGANFPEGPQIRCLSLTKMKNQDWML